jgi:RNA polymerase sigma factor (sigma-70 family)
MSAVAIPSGRRDELGLLLERAAQGDQRAWSALVARFDRAIHAVARRHGLCVADQDEVAQRTWLAFVRHIGRLRDHPAVAGWLITTARRECVRLLSASGREIPSESPASVHEPLAPPIDDEVLTAERRDALHRALEAVPVHEQRLMRLLLTRPELSYDEISAVLGMPKGSIGPTRGRCIARLREDRQLTEICAEARA